MDNISPGRRNSVNCHFCYAVGLRPVAILGNNTGLYTEVLNPQKNGVDKSSAVGEDAT